MRKRIFVILKPKIVSAKVELRALIFRVCRRQLVEQLLLLRRPAIRSCLIRENQQFLAFRHLVGQAHRLIQMREEVFRCGSAVRPR